MARASVPAKPKETAAEKRARGSLEAMKATSGARARRGEDDEPETSENSRDADADTQPEAPAPEVPHPAPAPDTQVHQGRVITAREENNPFEYIAPPEDATLLERLAHAQRGIVRAVRGAAKGLGELERDTVLVLGEYFHDVKESKSYKEAGHKSVEAFVEKLGIPGLGRKDYYRIVEAHEVFKVIGDMIDSPLGATTIRELAPAVRKSAEFGREVFAEMKRQGRVSGSGAVAVRRLLAAGDLTEIIEVEKDEPVQLAPVERMNSLRKAGKIVDLQLLKEVAQIDPDSAKAYVDDLEQAVQAAKQLLG